MMRFLIVLPAMVLSCVLCSGCSSDSESAEEPKATFLTPTEFEEANVTWSKVEDMEEEDTEQLTEYFADNPSVSENPAVEGDPLVYSGNRGTKRYYWVRKGADAPEWFCLQFDGYDVEVSNGQGEPFTPNDASL
jgi:hypothetical protein